MVGIDKNPTPNVPVVVTSFLHRREQSVCAALPCQFIRALDNANNDHVITHLRAPEGKNDGTSKRREMLAATSIPSHLPGRTIRGHALAAEAVRQSRACFASRLEIRLRYGVKTAIADGLARRLRAKGRQIHNENGDAGCKPPPPPTRSKARSLAAATPDHSKREDRARTAE